MRPSSLAAAVSVLALCAHAQQPPGLTLSGEAGSYPGKLALELGGAPVGRAGGILLSATAGPTPLNLVNPGDPRVLHVGLPFQALSGVFLPPGKLKTPTFTVPGDPSLLDATIYAQGIALNFSPLVDLISQPYPIRFAPAGKFRDRRTQFTTPRAFFPLVRSRDRKVMMVGGGSGALLAQIATKKTEVYDPVTDGFAAGPDMTVERSLHSATELKDGRYLVVGGVDVKNDPQPTAEIYDTPNDVFVKTKPMAVRRAAHTASLLPDGRVLVAGGIVKVSSKDILGSIGSIQKTTEIHDPKTGTWTKGPDMNDPRAGHAAITLSDGRILLAGGISWFRFIVTVPKILKECDIYDPRTNKITRGPSMGTAHAIGAVVQLSAKRWMIAGGGTGITLAGGGNITVTDAAEIYSETANAWSSAGKLVAARGALLGFDVGGGKFLFVGGGTGTLLKPIASDLTDVYDLGTQRWSAGPKMSRSRLGFGAYVNVYGQVHLLGGGSGPAATVNNRTDWYFRR